MSNTTPLTISHTESAQYIIDQDAEYSLLNENNVFVTGTTVGTVAYCKKKTEGKIDGTVNFVPDMSGTQVLDSNVICVIPRLKFTLTGAKLGDGTDVTGITNEAQWNTLFNDFQDISFKPFNLINNIKSRITVLINGEKLPEVTNISKLMIELNKFYDKHDNELFNSYSVGRPDTMHTFYKTGEQKKVVSLDGRVCNWNNKDSDSPFSDNTFTDSDTNSRRPLFVYPNSSIPAENIGFIIENIQFPIPLAVFSSLVGKEGFYGVRELDINFNMDLNGYKCLSIRPNKAPTTIDFANSGYMSISQDKEQQLYLSYKTYSIPKSAADIIAENKSIVPNSMRQFSSFKSIHSSNQVIAGNYFNGGVFSRGETKTFYSNQLKLTEIPEKIYVVINKIKRDTNNTFPAEVAMTPSVSCRVKNLFVDFDGATTTIYEPEEISKLSAKNGCTIDYAKTLYTHGQVICLNLSTDISTTINTPINNAGNHIMQINFVMESLTVDNTKTAPFNELYDVNIFTQGTKLLALTDGKYRVKDFFLGAEDVQFAMNNHLKGTKYKRTGKNIIRGGNLPALFARYGLSTVKNGPGLVKLADKIYRDANGGSVIANAYQNTTGGVKKRTKKTGGADVERVQNI